jgi:hypothetical protein
MRHSKYFICLLIITGLCRQADGQSTFGAITGAVIVLGRRSITDIPTAALAAAALVVLLKVKKVPEPLIVLAACTRLIGGRTRHQLVIA